MTIAQRAVIVESGSRIANPGPRPDCTSIASISRTGLRQRDEAPDRSRRRKRASSTSVARSEIGKILPLPSILVATRSSSNSRTVASTSSRRNAGRGTHRSTRTPVGWRGCLGSARIVGRIDRSGDDVEPAQTASVGQITPRAAGDQDLHTGPAILLEQDDARTALGGPRRGDQSRGPRAQDRHVIIEIDRFHHGSLTKKNPSREEDGEESTTDYTNTTDGSKWLGTVCKMPFPP